MLQAKDLRELSPEELQKKLRETRDELANLRLRKQIGQVENTAALRELRRDIARILTVLRAKEVEAAATAE